MSLRLQINLIIAVLMSLFIGTVVYQQIQDTRSSVREERPSCRSSRASAWRASGA